MYLRTIFTTLLFISFGFAQQQAQINGQIFDAANGQPVRNASVTVKQNPALAAKTDTDGKYQLSVPVGKYTLLIKAENFLDAEIDEVNAVAEAPVTASTVLAAKGSVTSVDVTEKIGAVAATAAAEAGPAGRGGRAGGADRAPPTG